MRLPSALLVDGEASNEHCIDALQCYFGVGEHVSHLAANGKPFWFTGAMFDVWDSTSLRTANANRFTADDVVAVSFLSVDVPAEASIKLLGTEAAEFSALLEELGPDRDLVLETTKWEDDWVGWVLHQKLLDLPGVGPTTATKLLARKRPRLRPIYDTKIVEVIGVENVWEALRAELQARPDLHDRLLGLRDSAGVSPAVSAIRIFDVLAWMQGTGKGCARVTGHRQPPA